MTAHGWLILTTIAGWVLTIYGWAGYWAATQKLADQDEYIVKLLRRLHPHIRAEVDTLHGHGGDVVEIWPRGDAS